MKTDVFNDIKYLYINLPEDLRRLKDIGDFDELKKIIDIKLEKIEYEPLAKRLMLEKHIVDIYQDEYIYTLESGYNYANERLKDFSYQEFLELIDKGSIDYIYKNKEIYLLDTFYDNIIKTVKGMEDREIKGSKQGIEGESLSSKSKVLDDMISKVKSEKEVRIKYEVLTELRLNKSAVREGEKIRVHLPIPLEGYQISEVEILSNEHDKISNKDNLSQTVYFEKVLAKDDVFRVKYSFINTSKYVELDAEKGNSKDLDFCIEEKAPHIVFTPYLKKLHKEIVGDETNKIIIARKIYDYITKNVYYSFLRPYITYENIPEYTAVNLKGDCGFQALTFITLCRMSKIPAIWQSGMFASEGKGLNHDWCRFYVEPYGWVFADVSFGNSGFKLDKKEKHDFYFGNLEPFRLVFNNDYYIQLDPKKEQFRHDPYDNQSGEVEYDDYGLKSSEFSTVTKIEKMEIL